MKREITKPHVEFLLEASPMAMQEFELSRLNLAANLRKQIRAIEFEIVTLEAEALLARWLLEYPEARGLGHTASLQKTLDFIDGPVLEPHAMDSAPYGLRRNASD